MPFRFSLYRAPEGLGPLHAWECEHRELLGSRNQLRDALEGVLPGLRWQESSEVLVGSAPFDGDAHAVEISLFGRPADLLMEIGVYARPPAIREIMSGLRLNHCYAPESGELCFPFKVGDHWPGAPR